MLASSDRLKIQEISLIFLNFLSLSLSLSLSLPLSLYFFSLSPNLKSPNLVGNSAQLPYFMIVSVVNCGLVTLQLEPNQLGRWDCKLVGDRNLYWN